MSGLIKARDDIYAAAGVQLKDTAVLSEISKAKAREESPDDMAIRAASDPSSSTSTLIHIAEVGFHYPFSLGGKLIQSAVRGIRGRFTGVEFTRF